MLQEFPNNRIFSGPPWDQPSVLETPSRRHPHATEITSFPAPVFWKTQPILVSLTIFSAALRVTQQCPPWHQFFDGKKKNHVEFRWIGARNFWQATEPEHPSAVRHWPPQWRHLHQSCCLTKNCNGNKHRYTVGMPLALLRYDLLTMASLELVPVRWFRQNRRNILSSSYDPLFHN